MDLFRAKLVTSLIAFGLIAGALIGALLYYGLPQFYPNWYFEIVFFFIVIESALISFVASSSKTTSSKKMVNIYMLTKVIKVIVSLIFITIYVLAVKENVKSFVLVFVTFYALYTGVETFLFSKIEKRLKENNNQ